MTNTVQVDPVAIDTEIAKLEGEITTLTYRAMRYTEREIEAKKPNASEWAKRPFNATEIADREAIRAKIAALREQVAPLHELYRKHGWNRWFWVQNTGGHLHTSMHCSTCFPSTRFAWVTDRSGVSVEAIVVEYGTDVCTVCVPTAPVLPGWGTSKSQKEKAVARAEREAKRAARQAALDAKSLREPVKDSHGLKVTSLSEAKRRLVDYLMDTRFGAHNIQNKSALADRAEAAERLVQAISDKLNQDPAEVLAEHLEKARAKYVKDLRYSIKNSGRWFGYYNDKAEAEAKLAEMQAELAALTGKAA